MDTIWRAFKVTIGVTLGIVASNAGLILLNSVMEALGKTYTEVKRDDK